VKTVRILSGILYHIVRLLALVFGATAFYAIAILLLSLVTDYDSLPCTILDGKFVIYAPFSRTPFLLGDYTATYLVPMISATVFYMIFFWLLGNVFDAFRKEKLFVVKGVRQLSSFYKTNLLIPMLILVLALIYQSGINDFLMITFLHGVIGIFAFFMAAIFREGVLLQEEQDLTL